MDPNQEILQELKNINQKIEKFVKPSRHILFSFLIGTFRSLGALFGTLIVASILIYIFSQFNFSKSISSFIENTLGQVNFEKIINPELNKAQQKIIESN